MHLVFALSLQGTLKDIGALAGLVAIPGVAVLALLYFAQAREVKRLREWAGRAPERAAELQGRVGQQMPAARTVPPQPVRRVVPQPVARPAAAGPAPPAAQTPAGNTPGNASGQPSAGAPRPATSAASPVPASAAARSAASPVPASAAARSAAAAAGSAAAPGAAAAEPGTSPGSAPPRPPGANATGNASSAVDRPRSAEMAGGPAAPAPTGTRPAGGAAPAAARPTPQAPPAPRPVPPTAQPPAASAPLRTSAPSATMPPRAKGLLGRMGRRGTAIVSAAILVLVLVGVFILTQSGGGSQKAQRSTESSSVTPTQTSPGQSKKSGSPAGPASRGQTTVSVLNGTTTPGLAANISDQLQRGGFKRGSVTNAADQQRPETLVNYAPGFKRTADEIAQLLKLKTVAPIDPGTQAIAGTNAQVVVTVGTDRTK